jgi:hypothetical protein
MIETFNAKLRPSEDKLRQLIAKRKQHGLSPYDLMLLEYLIRLSQDRIYIKYSLGFLAETLDEPYSKVAASIHKFKELDLVKKITFKIRGVEKYKSTDGSGLIVSPFLVNPGNLKRRALKVKVWNENKARLGEES